MLTKKDKLAIFDKIATFPKEVAVMGLLRESLEAIATMAMTVESRTTLNAGDLAEAHALSVRLQGRTDRVVRILEWINRL